MMKKRGFMYRYLHGCRGATVVECCRLQIPDQILRALHSRPEWVYQRCITEPKTGAKLKKMMV